MSQSGKEETLSVEQPKRIPQTVHLKNDLKYHDYCLLDISDLSVVIRYRSLDQANRAESMVTDLASANQAHFVLPDVIFIVLDYDKEPGISRIKIGSEDACYIETSKLIPDSFIPFSH